MSEEELVRLYSENEQSSEADGQVSGAQKAKTLGLGCAYALGVELCAIGGVCFTTLGTLGLYPEISRPSRADVLSFVAGLFCIRVILFAVHKVLLRKNFPEGRRKAAAIGIWIGYILATLFYSMLAADQIRYEIYPEERPSLLDQKYEEAEGKMP